jgi:hypothetical protein
MATMSRLLWMKLVMRSQYTFSEKQN